MDDDKLSEKIDPLDCNLSKEELLAMLEGKVAIDMHVVDHLYYHLVNTLDVIDCDPVCEEAMMYFEEVLIEAGYLQFDNEL